MAKTASHCAEVPDTRPGGPVLADRLSGVPTLRPARGAMPGMVSGDGAGVGCAASRGLTINGKFLQGDLTGNGVHRVALNFAAELLRRLPGGTPGRLLAPALGDWEPLAALGLTPELRPGALGPGQAWEMLTLPALARGELLVNFCNLAPVLHPNSVVMIHDVQTLTVPEAYPARQVAGYRMLWPLIGRRARAILTVSEHSRQALAAHGIGTLDKIHVVYNGTDHLLRQVPDTAILDRLGLAGRPFALALGSVSGYKNMRRLFAAFHDPALAGLPLVLTGAADRRAYEDRGWAVPPNVIFAGRVSDGALRALYGASRMFLFPSETEGFGLPPVEAMHCGTAVVAARGGAIPEVCGEGAVLVEAGETAGWVAAIARLAGDDAARAGQVARGRTRARALTWDIAGDRLWQVLEPML